MRRLCGPCPNYFGQLYLIVCADTDRCSYNNGGCSSLATCTNTDDGGRKCTCITGYTGDGLTCTGKIRLSLAASPLVPLQRSRPRRSLYSAQRRSLFMQLSRFRRCLFALYSAATANATVSDFTFSLKL